ncbi:MAG: hypothetical protein HQL86_03060 [Magnetococcales bacterium]|nr:hypothetical protein [Magnetococcales bacterium]
MALNRQQILDAQDLKTVDVDVPEWGGPVRIREFSGKDRDAFLTAAHKRRDKGVIELTALLVALAIVDDDGEEMFTEADIQTLNTKSAHALVRLEEEIRKLNRMNEEEAEKNSDPGQTG